MTMYELSDRNMQRARREIQELAVAQPRISRAWREVQRRLDCPKREPVGRRRPQVAHRFSQMIDEVEVAHELRKGDIYLDTNVPAVVAARRDAFVRLREAKLSYPAIAYMFGMNHSTVIYHVSKYKLKVISE